jgi:hypothetical protein
LPLVHEIAGPEDRVMLDIAIAFEINLVGDPALIAADAAREAGNSPNTVMAAAAAIIGPKRVERALACTRALIDLFAHSGLLDAHDESFALGSIEVDEKQDAHSLGHGRGAASTARRWFWRAVFQRAGRHRVRRHSSERNGRATMWARDDVELRAFRGGSPRAQPLRFDALEPSSAGWAFRRSRHRTPPSHTRRTRRSSSS